MAGHRAGEYAPRELHALLRVLELGHWRLILCWLSRPSMSIALPAELVGLLVAMGGVATAMRAHVHGEVNTAWHELGRAAMGLPAEFRRVDRDGEHATVVLPPRPGTGEVDATVLAWLVARLIWREQRELRELRRRFQPEMTAREELTWACIEHLRWIDCCPFGWYRERQRPELAAVDGSNPERTRGLLCDRGTRLRQFAFPATGRLSQSVWRDVGGYRGLRAEADDLLAAQALPAPWWGAGGTEDLPVRVGRFRAWEQAILRRAALDQIEQLFGDSGLGRPSA